jgi:hypothetical protein
MVTREEAIERMERAIGDQQGGGFRPGSFTGEAEAALDALLDYLEEQSYVPFTAGLIADLRGEEAANG